MSEDVTESTMFGDSEFCRILFERSTAGIFLLEGEGDDAGRVVAANTAAAAMHDRTLEEIIGMSVWDFEPSEYAAALEERFERIHREGSISGEVEHFRRDGSRFPVEYHAHLVDLAGRKYVLSFVDDVSEKRHTEEELRSCEERLRSMV